MTDGVTDDADAPTDEVTDEASSGLRRLAVVLVLAGTLLVAVAVVALIAVREATPRHGEEPVAADSGDGDGDGDAATSAGDRDGEGAPVTEAPPSAGTRLYEASCQGELVVEATPGIADPNLVEVSGIAVDPAGVAWVHNDSGDAPRLYGVRDDGSVQVVDVVGAEAVDWEDLALEYTDRGPVLWIADTGSNIAPRTTVQLYRVPVPGPGAAEVTAERFDVTYPDGSHDVEALFVETDGTLALVTKDPGTPSLYRVDPTGPAVPAVLEGSFSVGDGVNTTVTAADLAPDGSTVVLRTYGSVFLVPVDADQPVLEALQATDRRCRGIPPLEVQGEAIAFLPDGAGYVTVGEGIEPHRTTVRAP